jgi:hypothetical protein|tara:strand:+ start:392 stop:853 length:462 start_codon:yes stop_codon:yes gene_type:complete
MENKEKHSGGCACGKVRYHSIGKPARTGLCHCRYCQLRTGTAFGISVYFKKENLIVEKGELKKYPFTTESGNIFETNFCTNCGTSMFWTLSHMPDLMGAAGGSYDPPTFWFDIHRELFKRTKAEYVRINCTENHTTSPLYKPIKKDPSRLSGK